LYWWVGDGNYDTCKYELFDQDYRMHISYITKRRIHLSKSGLDVLNIKIKFGVIQNLFTKNKYRGMIFILKFCMDKEHIFHISDNF
jgi:hypothetical protein